MPPKQTTPASTNKRASTSGPRVPAAAKRQREAAAAAAAARAADARQVSDDTLSEEDDEDRQKSIPPALLTRLLHEFFEKEGTRITKDANEAVAKYMDVFVREAIARSVAERESGFLEVSYMPVEEGCTGREKLTVYT